MEMYCIGRFLFSRLGDVSEIRFLFLPSCLSCLNVEIVFCGTELVLGSWVSKCSCLVIQFPSNFTLGIWDFKQSRAVYGLRMYAGIVDKNFIQHTYFFLSSFCRYFLFVHKSPSEILTGPSGSTILLLCYQKESKYSILPKKCADMNPMSGSSESRTARAYPFKLVGSTLRQQKLLGVTQGLSSC